MPGSNGSGPRKPQLPGTIRAARLKPAIFTPTEEQKGRSNQSNCFIKSQQVCYSASAAAHERRAEHAPLGNHPGI